MRLVYISRPIAVIAFLCVFISCSSFCFAQAALQDKEVRRGPKEFELPGEVADGFVLQIGPGYSSLDGQSTRSYPPRNSSEFAELDKELSEFLRQVLTLGRSPEPLDIELVKRLFSYKADEPTGQDLARAIEARRLGLVNDDVGLHVVGYLRHDLGNGVVLDEGDVNEGSGYLGLEWDMLANGLYERGLKKRSIEYGVKAKEALEYLMEKEERFPGIYYRAIYAFNFAKAKKLGERVNFLDKYIGIAEGLYRNRYFAWEDVLKLKEERAGAENMLKAYANYNRATLGKDFYEPIDASLLPVFDIDLGTLSASAGTAEAYAKAAEYAQLSARDDDDIWRKITLKLSARYHVNDAFASDSTDSASLGLYFRMPLPLNSNREMELKDAELALDKHRLAQRAANDHNRLQDAYYEYQYKLNDMLKFSHRRSLIEERLRKEYVKKSFGDPDYAPLQTLSLLNELYAVDFELLDIKQKLYLKMLEMHRLTKGDEIYSALRVVDLAPNAYRHSGSRSIYLWSDAFNRLDNRFLVWYLKTNEVKNVVVSFGSNADREKLKSFVASIREAGITLEAMTGDNSLVFEDKRQGIAAIVKEASSLGAIALHLDVEPHTFDDWGVRKEHYIALFLSLLQEAKTSASSAGLKLSVSIPVSLPDDALAKIDALADRVYVMAYGSTDVATVVNRLKGELAASRDKLTIALRPDDFTSRLAVEEFAGALMRAIDVNSIAMHDLRGMLRLDERSIAIAERPLSSGSLAPIGAPLRD